MEVGYEIPALAAGPRRYEVARVSIEEDIIRRAMSVLGKRGGPARAAALDPNQRSEIARRAGLAGGKGRPRLEVDEMVEYFGTDEPGIYRIEVRNNDNTFTIAGEDLKLFRIERSLLRRCWRYVTKDGYPPVGQEVVASYVLEGSPYSFPGWWDGRWWRSYLDADFSDRVGVVYAWRPFLAGERCGKMLSRVAAPLPRQQ
ncbi:MAG TPA: hypothetical protein VHB47_05340 [Thermoanaerobaculia bacterium]|nr:hypothetical protein [Thermoanaerobaculia bacterium]